MRVSCMPSAECDDAHEAKQLFDVVGLLCAIFSEFLWDLYC